MKKKYEDDKNEKENNLIIIAAIALIVIVGLWLFTYYKLKDLSQTDRGTFGDMFGSVNALFSGLALAGIILTILLQKKELSLQRQELTYTRNELQRTADAQEKSEIALNRQAENLKISAKLTALNTLFNYYADLEKSLGQTSTTSYKAEIKLKKNGYLKRIEDILEKKENS